MDNLISGQKAAKALNKKKGGRASTAGKKQNSSQATHSTSQHEDHPFQQPGEYEINLDGDEESFNSASHDNSQIERQS